ncbi:hypothetical protein LJR225_000721 [Phenylobacterium sp. LjRoot225]|uniref:hypothetical protein n=1 Tax=Phenylobacterium sp. LjRoot225 TaxID=3342285 RepID=UPI003ECCB9A9
MRTDTTEFQAQSPTDPSPKAGPKTRLRTLNDLDRRTRAAQATFKLRDEIAEDLGGLDGLSAMERELVANSALMGAMLRDLGASYLTGAQIDLTEFMALANAQRRLLEALGLRRRPRDVTPSLKDLIEGAAR